MIDQKVLKKLIRGLDSELRQAGNTYVLILLGASALIISGTIERGTIDIDIVEPEMDPALHKAVRAVADKYGLDYGWLNSSASVFSKTFPRGWKRRTETYFTGKALTIKTLGRRDLIFSKLYAATERLQRDLEDLVSLSPTLKELQSAEKQLRKMNDSQLFQDRIERVLNDLRRKIAEKQE